MPQYTYSPLESNDPKRYGAVNPEHIFIGEGNKRKTLVDALKDDNGIIIVETKEELKTVNSKEGLIAYVKDEKLNYQYTYDKDILDWHELYTGTKPPVLKVAEGGHVNNSKIFLSDIPETLIFDFSTTNAGGASYLYIERDGTNIGQVKINGGSVQYVLKDIPTGTYTYSFSAKDGFLLPSNSITYTIVSGGLKLTSTFDETIKDIFVYDGEGSPINTKITAHYTLESAYDKNNTDDNETNDVKIIEKVTKDGSIILNNTKTKVNSGTYSVEIPNTGTGKYILTLSASTKDGDTTVTPNPLMYTFNVISTKEISILVNTDKFNNYYDTNARVSIPVILTMYNNNTFTVNIKVKNSSAAIITEKEYNCISGLNLCTIGSLKAGTYSLEVTAYNKDKTITKTITVKGLTIATSSYEMLSHTTDGLIAYYDAKYYSNSDTSSRNIWKNQITTVSESNRIPDINLYGLNYNTNGWLSETDKNDVETYFLKFTGESYGELNYSLLNAINTQAYSNGFTIEILYRSRCIGDLDARVINCNTYNDKSEIGFNITTDSIKFNSADQNLTLDYSEEEWTRATFTVRRQGDQYLMLIYLNGIISGIKALTDLSKFYSPNDIISLNSYKNINGEYTSFGSCEIRNIRIYNKALTSAQIVNNLISDINNKDEQQQKYLQNNITDGKNTLPIVKITTSENQSKELEGKKIWEHLNSLPQEAASKKVKLNATIEYYPIEEDEQVQSFFAEVGLQGTSTLAFPVRNYKLYVYEDSTKIAKKKISPKKDWIPESKFTLKCDYMESSHMNNIGTATWVHDMYKTWEGGPALTPPQKKEAQTNADGSYKYRTSIDGFPILLIIDDYTVGTYTFNVDKDAADTFGFKEENPVLPEGHEVKVFSYEITANSNGNCAGSFSKWTPEWSAANKNITEDQYYDSDFEIRYIKDEDDPALVAEGRAALKRLVNWVSDADDETFRNEFDQYLDLKYCIDYYIQVLTFGMVDSFGKNCMLNTWDGKIWYPTFYDMDTMLGLRNTGQDNIPCDIELPNLDEDDSKMPERFSAFNTNRSNLWRKLQRVFAKEIAARYTQLRANYYTWDNFKANYFDKISLAIGEYYYNLNAETKYVPYPQQFLLANGNRVQRVKRWVTERLAFTDTLFNYINSEANKTIVLRVNPQNGQVNFTLKVRTYSPVYLTVNYRNSQGDGGKTQPIYCTRGTFYNRDNTRVDYATVEFQIQSSGDQEVSINCANHLMELIGLEELNLSTLDIKNATRLTNINVVNSKLKEISFGTNKYLTNLDISNCVNFNTNVDLSKCTNIKTINCVNSPISGISIAEGGALKTLKLDNTKVSLLELKSLQFLDTLSMVNCSYLGQFSATDCSKIESIDLTNTSIFSFAINSCNNLKTIILDKCNKLINASFESSYNVETLQVNSCSLLTSLDVSSLYGLKNLRINDTIELEEIILPYYSDINQTGRYNKLKRFAAKGSSIKRFKYGIGDTNVLADGILNFEPLINLQALWIPQCKNIIEIRSLTITPRKNTSEYLSTINFKECSNLTKLSGNIKCEVVDEAFLKCSQLQSLANDDLLIDFTLCSTITSIAQESGINMASAQKIMNACGDRLTTAYAAFNLCTNITGELPNTFFNKTPNIKLMKIMFRGTNITSIAEGFLDKLTSLQSLEWTFRQCSKLRQVPISLFNKNTKLQSLHDTFYGCTNMYFVDANKNKTTILTNLLKGLTDLVYLTTAFYGCKALEVTDITDLLKDTSKLAFTDGAFYDCIKFKAPIPNYLFSKCSALQGTGMMFVNCDLSATTLPDYLFTDQTRTVKLTKLNNIAGMFANTHIQGIVKKDLFLGAESIEEMGRHTINLKPSFAGSDIKDVYIYSSGFFAGCDITAVYDDCLWNTPNIVSIKELFMDCSKLTTTYILDPNTNTYAKNIKTNNFSPNFFSKNIALIDARGVFKSCIGLVGDFPSNMFEKNINLQDISNIFDGCSTNGSIGADIFKNNTALTNISYAFANNGTLSGGIPENLLSTNTLLTDASYLFADTNIRETIPENLFKNNTKLIDISGAFAKCKNLKGSIPATLLYSLESLEKCNYLFQSCEALNNGANYSGTIVSNSFFSKNKNLEEVMNVFYECSNLNGTVPNDLFKNNKKITKANSLFIRCKKLTGPVSYTLFEGCNKLNSVSLLFKETGITSLESDGDKYFLYSAINSGTLTDMYQTFNQCTALTGTVHDYWHNGCVTSYSQAFTGCSSNFINNNNIPAAWC